MSSRQEKEDQQHVLSLICSLSLSRDSEKWSLITSDMTNSSIWDPLGERGNTVWVEWGVMSCLNFLNALTLSIQSIQGRWSSISEIKDKRTPRCDFGILCWCEVETCLFSNILFRECIHTSSWTAVIFHESLSQRFVRDDQRTTATSRRPLFFLLWVWICSRKD
jgi:hypothetical protein